MAKGERVRLMAALRAANPDRYYPWSCRRRLILICPSIQHGMDGTSSSVAQRTRARKFQNHPQIIARRLAAEAKKQARSSLEKATDTPDQNMEISRKRKSGPGKATNQGSSSSERAAATPDQVSMEMGRKRKSGPGKATNQGSSSSQRAAATPDQVSMEMGRKRKSGPGKATNQGSSSSQRAAATPDQVSMEMAARKKMRSGNEEAANQGGSSSQVKKKSGRKKKQMEPKSSSEEDDSEIEVIAEIPADTSKQVRTNVEAERNGARKNRSELKKGRKTGKRRTYLRTYPKEDDDGIVEVGSEKVQDPGVNNNVESTSPTGIRDEGLDPHASEDGADSNREGDDSTDSSNADHSSDEDFEVQNYSFPSRVESLSSDADEADNDAPSSDKMPATKVIPEACEDEIVNLCSNGVDETESMAEEINKEGGDLPKFAPTKPSSTEANESNHAKRVTRNKPTERVQIEESLTKRRYLSLTKQQKDQSSTSSVERRNDNISKNLSGEKNEKVCVEEEETECFTETRQVLEGRNDNISKNLNEEINEKACGEEETSECFAKTTQVHVKNDKDFTRILANAILREEEVHIEPSRQEVAEPSPSDGRPLPLKFRFEDDEPKVPEKSDYEKMVADLFAEIEIDWAYESMNTPDLTKVDHERAKASRSKAMQINSCGEGKHDLIRYEQIGYVCRRCHLVVHESRDLLPELAKNARGDSRRSFLKKGDFLVKDGPDGVDVSTTMENLDRPCNKTGTIWSIVPGVRQSMYEHQQEGFEFLWKNLEGTTQLAELNSTDSKEGGGCIISHAPGTGKTRLSIVFVQSYLRQFPESRPVIIAPASMLLTWEEEFKKWEVEFPFHNLCNPELSGKENKDLLKLFTTGRSPDNNKVRWVKIFTWRKEASILGISYNLYEKLAGEKVALDEDSQNLRRILLQLPKLVILDEGHIPRNQSSSIWKTLLKLQTKKRIILSGTPFQNNFEELFNTLHLVRPGILEKEKLFVGMVPSRRKYSRKQQARREFSVNDSKAKDVDKAIEKVKSIMQPFVHVHKGSILQKSLPGLTDCVILLDPKPMQKSFIETLEYSENTFELGYKVALLSVHPSLAEHCWSSAYESSGVSKDTLRELRLDSNVGAKTKFIMSLIQFSTTMNEKVLIFSQYIHPLELIKDQLKAHLDWHEGKEILQMQGGQEQFQRQSIINMFNNPKSEAKVLLAATKCCSEGISLVGASRVVLLDVVWNPSVERQAISRAYRLGQKKVVYTYHLITSGTNEGDKYCRQAEKDRLSDLVFSSTSVKNDEPRFPTTAFEDRILEKLVNHVDLKDMFLKIISKPKEANLVETFGLVSPS